MTDNAYIPRPIPTDDVELSPELIELSEAIAKNVHEVWAQGRLDDGWTWGETLDGVNKKHPSLIPYEELSDEEKDYDRNTAMGTLRLVAKLGFTISRREP